MELSESSPKKSVQSLDSNVNHTDIIEEEWNQMMSKSVFKSAR